MTGRDKLQAKHFGRNYYWLNKVIVDVASASGTHMAWGGNTTLSVANQEIWKTASITQLLEG